MVFVVQLVGAPSMTRLTVRVGLGGIGSAGSAMVPEDLPARFSGSWLMSTDAEEIPAGAPTRFAGPADCAPAERYEASGELWSVVGHICEPKRPTSSIRVTRGRVSKLNQEKG